MDGEPGGGEGADAHQGEAITDLHKPPWVNYLKWYRSEN